MADDEREAREIRPTESHEPEHAPRARAGATTEPQRTTVGLPSGRRVEVTRAPDEQLVVYGPSGTLEVEIRLTPQGPQLFLSGAAIHLQSAGVVSVDCERFRVNARADVQIAAGGALRQTAGGAVETTAGGALATSAREVTVKATEGDATFESQGDLWIDGRNVLINS